MCTGQDRKLKKCGGGGGGDLHSELKKRGKKTLKKLLKRI